MRAAIQGLSESSLTELAGQIRADAQKRGLTMQGEGRDQEMIPVVLTPWVADRESVRYFQSLLRGIRRTINRVLSNYFDDPKLQEILPLRETELEWLKATCTSGMCRPQTVFERFDTNLGPDVEKDLSSFQILEFNAVGVGCIYLMPAVTELIAAQLFPHLADLLKDHPLVSPSDYRDLLVEQLKAHSKAIGRDQCRVGLVERRETTPGGTDEFNRMMPFFQEKGVPVVVGDPREVERRNGDLLLKGEVIDVIYRDFQLEEVVSIKTHGGSVEGIETAFSRNQVVSTVFGEFDHKSLCELLTNPDYSSYFSMQELRAARRRVPWTRLVNERRTPGMEGAEVDLLSYIREHREQLVLKPNRGYGGEGVIVGEKVTQSAWEEALDKAAVKPKGWVTQEKVKIARAPVMILREKGKPQIEEQYVTLSITATPRGVAFVGRSSADPVVNISQGGGLVPLFLKK